MPAALQSKMESSNVVVAVLDPVELPVIDALVLAVIEPVELSD